MFRPFGVLAIIESSGAFEGYWPPGIYFCLPWTQIRYLVSMQDFVFEKPSNPFVTKDNVPVDISVSILMKIKEPEGGSEAVY